MQTAMEKIEDLTKELITKTFGIKHGKVSINLDIHNGRITAITNTTTINVRDYLNEENKLTVEKGGENEKVF